MISRWKAQPQCLLALVGVTKVSSGIWHAYSSRQVNSARSKAKPAEVRRPATQHPFLSVAVAWPAAQVAAQARLCA